MGKRFPLHGCEGGRRRSRGDHPTMVGRAPRARRNTTNNQKGKTKMIVKFCTMKGVSGIAASLFHNLRVQSVSWCPLSTFEQFSNFESDCIIPYGATRCDTPLSGCCFAALSNHPFRPFRLYAEAPRRVSPLFPAHATDGTVVPVRRRLEGGFPS